jgi:hypothetical protein
MGVFFSKINYKYNFINKLLIQNQIPMFEKMKIMCFTKRDSNKMDIAKTKKNVTKMKDSFVHLLIDGMCPLLSYL